MTKALSTSISLDRATLDRLDALAKANGRSRSSMVRWLIRQAAQQAEGEDAPVALPEEASRG